MPVLGLDRHFIKLCLDSADQQSCIRPLVHCIADTPEIPNSSILSFLIPSILSTLVCRAVNNHHVSSVTVRILGFSLSQAPPTKAWFFLKM